MICEIKILDQQKRKTQFLLRNQLGYQQNLKWWSWWGVGGAHILERSTNNPPISKMIWDISS